MLTAPGGYGHGGVDGALDTRTPPVHVVELLCLNKAAIGGRPFPGTRSWPTAELGVPLCGLVQFLILTPIAACACSVCMQRVPRRGCVHAVQMRRAASGHRTS